VRKILKISAWAFCGIAIVLLTGFAIHQHDSREATGIDIVVEPFGEHQFIPEESIKTLLIRNGFGADRQIISTIDIPVIEQLVLAQPAVENCEACITVEGKVLLKINQRRPIARFTNLAGESFYMDDKGKVMPWSETYTAPVILVNGTFIDNYAMLKNKDFSFISADSARKTETLLDDAWNILKVIDADSFLRVQMVQLYVSPENGFELIPRVGDHKIVFGDAESIEGKFKKLSLFYMYGLNKTGRWTEYSAIDLRYKNQIVCTKKPITNGI
jgi:cell division protein FtsQ